MEVKSHQFHIRITVKAETKDTFDKWKGIGAFDPGLRFLQA